MQIDDSPIHPDPELFDALPFVWAACSDIGRERQTNEDAYLVEPETGLFIVSDGMGGHQGGEIASAFVTADLSASIDADLHKLRSPSPQTIRRLILRAIRRHNKQVRMEGHSEAGYKGMGATLVLVLIQKGRATVANLGDSHCYRYRKGKLVQLSREHSVIGELIEQGKLLPEQAKHHEAAGMVTQYMGMDNPAQPHIRSFQLQPQDRLLLCSDGLTDMLSDKAIQAILHENQSPQQAVQCLVEQANLAGGYDNITVILIDWSGQAGKRDVH